MVVAVITSEVARTLVEVTLVAIKLVVVALVTTSAPALMAPIKVRSPLEVRIFELLKKRISPVPPPPWKTKALVPVAFT